MEISKESVNNLNIENCRNEYRSGMTNEMVPMRAPTRVMDEMMMKRNNKKEVEVQRVFATMN